MVKSFDTAGAAGAATQRLFFTRRASGCLHGFFAAIRTRVSRTLIWQRY
jgi:hypothetical protein